VTIGMASSEKRGFFVWWGVAVLSFVLFSTNAYHRVVPFDLRAEFSPPPIPYRDALRRLDALQPLLSAQEFAIQATQIYHSAIRYDWPDGLSRIDFRDNWILFLASGLDPLLAALKLQRQETRIFTNFESFKYQRALGRGFGICSQNALGLADLLHRRYGVQTRVVGLDGHVVLQIELDDGGSMISDPSLGLTLPFGIDDAPGEIGYVRRVYGEAGHAGLGERYDEQGNLLGPEVGAGPYAPPFYRQKAVQWFERTADVASWLLSFCTFLFAVGKIRRSRARR
jgi:hypothetical protein